MILSDGPLQGRKIDPMRFSDGLAFIDVLSDSPRALRNEGYRVAVYGFVDDESMCARFVGWDDELTEHTELIDAMIKSSDEEIASLLKKIRQFKRH